MVLIDYIFIFITIFYSTLGLMRGFSKQLISSILWISLLFIIFYHLDIFINIVASYISLESKYIRIITIISLILSTIIIIYILNITLSKVVALTFFEKSNRIFGLLASFIKAQIYIFVFILLILDTSFHTDVFEGSLLAPYYLILVEYISNYDDSLFNTFKI